jgi:hypothetical protein
MKPKYKWLTALLISGFLGIAIAVILALLGRGDFWQPIVN